MRLLKPGLCAALAVCSFEASAQHDLPERVSEIHALLMNARAASEAAASAGSVEEIKNQADAVFAIVWGQPSGLIEAPAGAAHIHGWKTRWQTDGTEFDEDHVSLHGSDPPRVSDPERLGIMGRGRDLIRVYADSSASAHIAHVIASVSNVIGWMRLDEGVTKGERQPRIDLTYVWDAPSRFWNTSADTGWLGEVFAQSVNILKTGYGDHLESAQAHARDMTALIDRCLNGVDENGDGRIAPVMMEGGIATALEHARFAAMDTN